MKNWLKVYKWQIVLSTALTLLPMLVGLLLWNRLPDLITTHWGGDGVADGFSGKAFAVFGLPAMMAGFNLVCCFATALDPKQAVQNKKAIRSIFWIMPVISLVICGMVYSIALGKTVDMEMLMPLLMGVMFVIMGNYLPKVKQNSTLGVKITWTLYNEENWNRTHRFTGKLWVGGGVVMLLSALLPVEWMIPVTVLVIVVLAIAPVVCSWRIYKAHRCEGIKYFAPPRTKGHKAAKWISLLLVIVILAGVAVLMFTGDITYTCTDSALQIEAAYHEDIVVTYDQIDTIELRENFDVGIRAMGFGSPRLSMGTFQNDEFGSYTLYSYNACDQMILIRSGGKVLAINAQTEAETEELYNTLLVRIAE